MRRRGKFDVRAFLDTAGVARRVVEYPAKTSIYQQGDLADSVIYIQSGRVKLSVLSAAGKEAVVGVLEPGDFFGEGCLAGQPRRMGSATAMLASTVLIVNRKRMARVLHDQHALSELFMNYLLGRNIRMEEDLVDQLFNSSEKRLARTLLLLARYGKAEKDDRVIPRISQEVLAEMVGTTRSRVNFFMNKFRKLGFVEYNGVIKINSALLSVVLHD